MAREINKLTARKAATLAIPGRHADGGGLYLVVDDKGARRWVMLYRMAGKRREMGLGPLISVPLAKARELAAEARAQIQAGIDPISARAPIEPSRPPAPPVLFKDVALAYMADRETLWSNSAHKAQWRQTLEIQAASLWDMPVASISHEDVFAVLKPIWHTRHETATRIRGRIERILDAARVGGHRSGDNPARWRGHLDALLPQLGKLHRGHHPAMPFKDVPAYYAALSMKTGHSARALQLAILTAARSGEIRGMAWGEVDIAGALWIVPAKRMKARREHRVPLSAPAIRLITEVLPETTSPSGLVLPSKAGTPLSDMALSMLMRKSGQESYTPHGFRSSFRDWVEEKTDFPGEIAEAALAHLTGDETERAYRRGDVLEKRRALMDQWAAFVISEAAST